MTQDDERQDKWPSRLTQERKCKLLLKMLVEASEESMSTLTFEEAPQAKKRTFKVVIEDECAKNRGGVPLPANL